jgi:hypothetical protein
MAWNLESANGKVILQTSAENLGAMSGTLTVDGIAFNVSGYWANGQGVPGRKASCFEISGQHAIAPNLPIYVGAAGNMVGTQNWPQSVQISGAYCSVADGIVHSFDTTLLPMMNTDPKALASAYAESGCVLVIDVSQEGVAPKCTAGFINGKPMATSDLGGVCTGFDPTTVNIPKQAPNKPVCVVFHSDVANHFINPPLAEAHKQILRIFYDAGGINQAKQTGLVLEYGKSATSTPTQVISFNERPEPMTHNSIIIKPG